MNKFVFLGFIALLSGSGPCLAQAEVEESLAGVIVTDESAQTQPEKSRIKRRRHAGSKVSETPIEEQNGPPIDRHGIDGY